MRPWVAETESRGGFLGVEFGAGYNDCAKRVTHFSGMLPVRVVNAPELVARFQSCGRAHAHISAQPSSEMVYLIHKMRG